MSVGGIILAGGSGSRVQREVNKVFLPVGEREMLAYSWRRWTVPPTSTRR